MTVESMTAVGADTLHLAGRNANTYLMVQSLTEGTPMSSKDQKKKDFSDEEVEDILDMQAPKDLVREFQKAVQESPLLMAGLVFTFGLLVGVSLSSGRKRSR